MKLVRSIRKRRPRLKAFIRLPQGLTAGRPSVGAARGALAPIHGMDRRELKGALTQNRWFIVDQVERLVPTSAELRCSICDFKGLTEPNGRPAASARLPA
jgi:hypothetical protein